MASRSKSPAPSTSYSSGGRGLKRQVSPGKASPKKGPSSPEKKAAQEGTPKRLKSQSTAPPGSAGVSVFTAPSDRRQPLMPRNGPGDLGTRRDSLPKDSAGAFEKRLEVLELQTAESLGWSEADRLPAGHLSGALQDRGYVNAPRAFVSENSGFSRDFRPAGNLTGGPGQDDYGSFPSDSVETEADECVFLNAPDYYAPAAEMVVATSKLEHLHKLIQKKILAQFDKSRNAEPESEESGEEEDENDSPGTPTKKVAQWKPKEMKPDPNILDADLLFNAKNRLNDGKLCRCTEALRAYGIKHGHLVGEEQQKFSCRVLSNNAPTLFCYRMVLKPVTNFTSSSPTRIRHLGRDYAFMGFCLLSHQKLVKYPKAQSIRFNISYAVTLDEIPVPGGFVVEDLNLFRKLVFRDILELKEWRLKAEFFQDNDGICDVFHFHPLFGRRTGDKLEIAPMSSVLFHFAQSFRHLFTEEDVELFRAGPDGFYEEHIHNLRGIVAVIPGKKPAAVRVDQIDRGSSEIDKRDRKDRLYPVLVHFATRSVTAGDGNLSKMWRKLDQMKNVLEARPKNLITPEEKMKIHQQQMQLDEMAKKNKMKKDVTIVLSSRGFYHSGLRSDVAQYSTLLPWVAFHFRYHISLDVLEQKLQYEFNDRNLLELALTHPSYRINMGTNPDHIRNIQSNLGFRKAAYGQAGTIPKSGIKTLIHTMAQLGVEDESISPIRNYERLEFLGDAVLEFLTSLRLFLIFRDIQEGGLATFRATLVQNSHLAVLGETYSLSHYLLISHGREEVARKRITDKHAAANCFEAICGAMYLDGGIRYVDEFFGRSLFAKLFLGEEKLRDAWMFPPLHVSKTEYPDGDRHLIAKHELLQRCTKFEEMTGIQFNHIRLLANAFSARQVDENPLTIGNNQRLEFLGDTVLQLIVSDHVFKHFPKHHEGHLSLLRSSLVSNKTQAIICDELGLASFQIKDQLGPKGTAPAGEIKLKDKADLVEAYLGALYLDQGLTICHSFCKIVFFHKLTEFIVNQSWSDPKSRLQQCCLTLRSVEDSAPKLPQYKVINKTGPSNNRVYEVAVYFNGQRLASASASNTKLAEESAAEAALKNPIFLSDYTRQQSFARKAVAAQKARNRQGPGGFPRGRGNNRGMRR